jgi:DNA-binding XRE family transcriptional regulator
MSIERLAEAAEVHRKTIIEVEAGRVAAKVTTLHGIAHGLGVPLVDIVGVLCARHSKSLHVATQVV